ncbi:MAG: 50S ribosomal protein L13 [Phycisphaerae bacterium]
MKTYMAKKGELKTKWFVADVSGKVLGRVATQIASVLMGKHRPEYTPNVDTGDFVVVLNAADIRITGANKGEERVYQRYSGYPGGRKEETLNVMLQKDPEKVIREAVRRMLPKTSLGEKMLLKLKVYRDDKHPHQAQRPETLEL